MRLPVIAAAAIVEFVVAVLTIPIKLSIDNHRKGADQAAEEVELAPVMAVVTPAGVVVPVVRRDREGWYVRTPCGHEATVPVAKPVRAPTVVLDPGHGGEDSGALGPNGLTEAQLNLDVARYAQAALERAKVPVVLTRTGPYGMTLDTRVELVTGLRPRAFVSVHHNSGGVVRSPRPGSEVYYQQTSPESRRLAGLLHEEVVRTLGALGGPWVAANAGAKFMLNSTGGDYFGLLRRSQPVVSTLAEMAYLNHGPEAQLLAKPEVQAAEGEALARAILRFLNTADPGSGYVDTNPPPRLTTGELVCTDPPL